MSAVLVWLADFARRHWRVLLVVGGLALAFAAGRFSRVARVETREVERVVYRDREVVVQAAARATERTSQTKRTVERTTTTNPNGTRVTHSISRTDQADQAASQAGTISAAARETATASEKETTKVVTRSPDWRVGALVGVDTEWTPRFGAHLERRLFGPVSVGVWGLAPVQGGVSLSVEF